ncbi:glycosyltransferase [Agromyces bauzanensis]
MSTIVSRRQRRLLAIAYHLFRPLALFSRRRGRWVVGTEEIAGMVSHIARALPRSTTVVHRPHAFYGESYDIVIQSPTSRFEMLRRLYGGPIVLAWLMQRAEGFIYVGSAGFLMNGFDEREFEFEFITRHGGRIVCYYTGNDIRSPKLMKELARKTGVPNFGTVLGKVDPVFETEEYEQIRKRRAEVTDAYAEVVFNARVDQLSYLSSATEPFLYFYPDDGFHDRRSKFADDGPVLIVHAPSNPALKGTDEVRRAISELAARRQDFEYRELSGVTNDEVLAALAEAHIVLNEFYSYMPGVFGIEAMANTCALVTSADPRVESDLGVDATGAWAVTPVDAIGERVEALLDDRAELRRQAIAGFEWARAHASNTASARVLREALARSDESARLAEPGQSQASTR